MQYFSVLWILLTINTIKRESTLTKLTLILFFSRMDATLKELTSLVKEVYPEARKKGTHFNFAIVYTDLKRPGYR